ncbi:MAG: valine--tRNA ligase [Clostridia bacterium]|nr:valine--tRNA ligase [Clostridia bacterium]
MRMLNKYEPSEFEEKIYKDWNEKGYFTTKVDKTRTPYTIVIPPPNVTGKLHMGHALVMTLQDILMRYKKLRGFNTLWVPGTDHAAIATEVKVVEKIKKEGKTKESLGREAFLEEAWAWTREYGGTIENQLKTLGCSCDWTRERFTMDEGLSKAVEHVFIKMYEKGAIYRGNRMINWCPVCKSSLSDIEVEPEEEASHLWHIRYYTKDKKEYVTVATTRPETMLGDTAVAVHPEDKRYKDMIGKTVVVPLVNREIPIVADEFVEKEFGTGSVKLTPAHDFNDYEAGIRHNLEMIEVFDEKGIMLNLVPKYQGMDLMTARKEIVKDLEELGALEKIEDYTHNVGKCYRCHNTVEPRISMQWFMKMEELAKPAIEAVKSGEIRFVPDRFDKTYYHWMENIKDWCISRQIWWGHRIPAYYCKDCGEIMVSGNVPDKCTKCGSTKIEQDPDTLDTWFSSALWPFSVMGWPEETEDFKYFYPTNTLVTAYDIIFFWVARMIFSGLEHTGKVPFDTVFMHGLVRDAQGRKMSKSLGNGIDPIDIIKDYGADSLRFSLVQNMTLGNDVKYSAEKAGSAKNFANKIWNAAKFVIANTDKEEVANFKKEDLSIEDKWLLNKLDKLVLDVTNHIEKYEVGIAATKIYDFIWSEYCDWYIEMSKPRLYNEGSTTKNACVYVLNYALVTFLKLLHPFMPFITEKIYQELDNEKISIMLESWPEVKAKFEYEEEEKNIEIIKNIIVNIRNIRANMNVVPSKKTNLIFVTTKYKSLIEQAESFLKKLGFAENIQVQEDKEGIPENSVSIVSDGIELFIPFEELVDVAKELERLEGEKEKLEKEVERCAKMLSNKGFVEKAPKAKIEEEEEKLAKYREMLETVEKRIKEMK